MPIPDILRYTRLTPWLAKARPGMRHRLGISVATLAGWLGVTPGHLNNMLQRARTLAELYLNLLGLGLGLLPLGRERLHLLWRLELADTEAERAELVVLLEAQRAPAAPRGRPRKLLKPVVPSPLGGACAALDVEGPPLDAWLDPALRVLASHPDPRVPADPELFWPLILPQQRPPRTAEPASRLWLDAREPAHHAALRQGLGLARLAHVRNFGEEQVIVFSTGALPAEAVPRILLEVEAALRRAVAAVPELGADEPARQVCISAQVLALSVRPDAAETPDHAALWAALGAPEPDASSSNDGQKPTQPTVPDVYAAPDVRTYLGAVLAHRRATRGSADYGSFARVARLSRSHVRNVFRDARGLTADRAAAFSRGLLHSPAEREHFALLVARDRCADPTGREALTRRMLLSTPFRAAWPDMVAYYEGFASALHIAVYALSGVRGFRADPTWIAGSFGVDPALARQALHDLIRHRFLVCGPDHRLRPARPIVASDPASHHPSFVRTADQMLMAAQLALGTPAGLFHQQVHLWVPLRAYDALLLDAVGVQRAADVIAAECGIDPQADHVTSWLVQCMPVTGPWPPDPAAPASQTAELGPSGYNEGA